MSGLAGEVGPNVTPQAVRGLLVGMRARGPDGDELRALPGAILGLTRAGASGLAASSDERWLVALDGTPLHLRSLRDELRARGLLGEDDDRPAAVAAAIFSEVGFERGWERITGECAVAAWDTLASTLWLARDRAGARPLAWSEPTFGAVRFASDAAALARSLHAPPRPDSLATLADGTPLAAPSTAFHGVHALAAGATLCASPAGVTMRPGPPLSANPAGAGGSAARWARSIELATELAVRHRVPTDGPVAVAVDGLYSSLVAGIVTSLRRDPPLLLQATWGESAPAPGVTAVPLGPDDLPAALADLAEAPAPLTHPDALVFWSIGRAAWERDCPRILTGVGGRVHELPGSERPPLGRIGRWARYAASEARLRAGSAKAPGAQTALDLRRIGLPDGALALLDGVGTATGVQFESPLADASLTALVAEVPADHLRDGPRSLFRRAFAARLGERVDALPGRAYPPLGRWLPGHTLLADLPERLRALVEPDHVAWHIARLREGAEGDAGQRVWALAVIAAWWERRSG